MSTWQTVWETIAADFADIPDAAQLTRVTVRLLFAAVLGGIIGYEREQRGKAAGFRTHILVAVGAALFVLVMQQSGGSASDISRVVQGIVAGIGFLGAGTILVGRREEEIQGLTTAASIWLTAAIGVAAGLGREMTALLATGLALVVLALLPRFAAWALPPREPDPDAATTTPAEPPSAAASAKPRRARK
jgi:putative Mg2+ transporter-C (MgtC) family protein